MKENNQKEKITPSFSGMTEIEFYKTWCSIVNDYEHNRSMSEAVSHSDAEYKAFLIEDFERIRKKIDHYYERGSLRMLKMCYRCFNETLPEPGDPDYPALNARLLAACGKGLDDHYKKRRERIVKIQERGKIRSDSEFYLIQEHIDYLINMNRPVEETKLFDGLLFDYEERARKRLEKRQRRE